MFDFFFFFEQSGFLQFNHDLFARLFCGQAKMFSAVLRDFSFFIDNFNHGQIIFLRHFIINH